jgi:hypothetical protein
MDNLFYLLLILTPFLMLLFVGALFEKLLLTLWPEFDE